MISSVTERATMRALRHALTAALVLAATTAFAQAGRGQAPPPADVPPATLSALAPSHIAKARPPAPFSKAALRRRRR